MAKDMNCPVLEVSSLIAHGATPDEALDVVEATREAAWLDAQHSAFVASLEDISA